MQACRAALRAPVGVGLGRPGAVRAPARPAPALTRPRPAAAPGARLEKQHTAGQRPRQLSVVAAAKAGGGGGSGSGKRGRTSHEPEPQPKLQAWLQRQGLTAVEADQHARRLAHVFGGDQQAALAGLPATFEWCRGKGLSGLQTAQLLDRIANIRLQNVVSFAATAQQDWQLIDDCTELHVQRVQQAGKRLPKHTSVVSLLNGSKTAPRMLAHQPGHVAAWLAEVSKQLPDAADVGRLLLSGPLLLDTDPRTPVAVLRWYVEQLSVPPAQLAAFAAKAPALLMRGPQSLQHNLAVLQEALPPQLALRLVQKQPVLLSYQTGTVQAALGWLRQQFDGNTKRLHAVLERCPLLLRVSEDSLQRRADYLQRQQGWQPGDGQLAAWMEAHPRRIADTDFESPDKQALLQLYSGVLGLDRADCLDKLNTFLARSLETTAARYMLVQERAPWLLYGRKGGPTLTWVVEAPQQLPACGAATKAEVLAFERSWPESKEGQRLLAALRSGSTEGWPLPPSWEVCKARKQQHKTEQEQDES